MTKSQSGYEVSPAPNSTNFGTLSVSGTTLTYAADGNTSTGTLSGNTITWTGHLNGVTWTADWAVSGHFLYSSADWPHPRFNAKLNALTSDRSTGTVTTPGAAGTQQIDWATGERWAGSQDTYTATIGDDVLTWNKGPAWTLVNPGGGVWSITSLRLRRTMVRLMCTAALRRGSS